MLKVVKTASVAAGCQVCQARILDKFNVESNLGSGKYAYHYHIDCFKREYGETMAQIMEMHSELNPVLVERANKPKPLWRIRRLKREYKVFGPSQYSSAWLGDSIVEGIRLDKLMQTTAVLAGKPYVAEIIDHFKVKDILTCFNPYGKGQLYYLESRKIKFIGTSKYTDASNIEHLKKMYLIEGITK